jgi:hypothetical protein
MGEPLTVGELVDMHLIYGETRGNARAAERLYRLMYPNRHHPNRATFVAVDRRLRETGTLQVRREGGGARRRVRTVAFEEEVLQRFEDNPSQSTRAIARIMRVPHMRVWEVLHDNLMRPYHRQKVQPLLPNDFGPRVQFCQWYIQRHNDDPHFRSCILFTDEASFTRDGILNFRNTHNWSYENPHAILPRGHQQRFSVNVWAGIIADRLIGPYMLPPRLTGNIYLTFLQEVLPDLLDDVPLAVMQRIMFQHDGAPAHFSRDVRQHLDQTYPDAWIGRGGSINWPARSPDLTPLDYFLWGHIKSLVYETPVDTEEDLVARIADACGRVQEMPAIFEHIRDSMVRRCEACIRVNGRNFEQLL